MTTCCATARRRTKTTRWRTFSSLRTNDQRGARGGRRRGHGPRCDVPPSFPRDRDARDHDGSWRTTMRAVGARGGGGGVSGGKSGGGGGGVGAGRRRRRRKGGRGRRRTRGGGGEWGRRRRRRRRRAGGRDRRPTSSNDNQPQLGESAAVPGEVELAAAPGERESAGAPGESTTTTCRATARRRRTMTTRWRWRTFSSSRTNDRGGVEGGEEEALYIVSALATSLPRDPTMRSSAGGFRGRRVVQVRPPPGGRRGGGREGRRMQRERGWNQSRVESRVVVVLRGVFGDYPGLVKPK